MLVVGWACDDGYDDDNNANGLRPFGSLVIGLARALDGVSLLLWCCFGSWRTHKTKINYVTLVVPVSLSLLQPVGSGLVEEVATREPICAAARCPNGN